MVPFGTPQRGLPWIPAIPSNHFIITIDIKDCFFSIPLHPDDMEKFAFSLPALNFSGPDQWFEWTVLPQGMANSPSICQNILAQIFTSFFRNPDILFYIYMDDIILGAPDCSQLDLLTTECLSILAHHNFKVAPEKIQRIPPFKILGSLLSLDTVSLIRPQLKIQTSYTLPQLQKLLGEINWMRPWISISTEKLTPLFDLLKGSNLSSDIILNTEHIQTLNEVQRAIDKSTLKRFTPSVPLILYVFPGGIPNDSTISPTRRTHSMDPPFSGGHPASIRGD